MMEEFVDEQIYPPSVSIGGNNAYYMTNCDKVGHRPSYCICLNKIKAFNRDGTLRGMDCETEIRNKVCPAISMQSEEELAGKAIYFINRAKLIAFNEERATRAKSVSTKPVRERVVQTYVPPPVKVSDTTISKPVVKSSPAPVDGYAAAINVAMTAVVEEPVVAVSKPDIKVGSSLLDVARSLLNKKD